MIISIRNIECFLKYTAMDLDNATRKCSNPSKSGEEILKVGKALCKNGLIYNDQIPTLVEAFGCLSSEFVESLYLWGPQADILIEEYPNILEEIKADKEKSGEANMRDDFFSEKGECHLMSKIELIQSISFPEKFLLKDLNLWDGRVVRGEYLEPEHKLGHLFNEKPDIGTSRDYLFDDFTLSRFVTQLLNNGRQIVVDYACLSDYKTLIIWTISDKMSTK